MTEDEVKAWNGKAVRATMIDGSVFAGTLHVDIGHGHSHPHYTIVSNPIQEGGMPIKKIIHGPEAITEILDASDDPAAVL